MPILAHETELHPRDLFDRAEARPSLDRWWVLYTLSRHEKQLMRRLLLDGIAFYCPLVPKRNRSPSGRVRTSQLPLFTNYVFMLGGEDERRAALETRCVSRTLLAPDQPQLTADLRQIHRLIGIGVPLTPEGRLQAGTPVRVKTGAFRGFEGVIERRQGRAHLLVAVNFLQQGASVLLDDCQVERLD
ncbi:MAG TPA: transcription termination/antitermination NusG family protein [Pirellulales bacterium]|jgi:transcriptional antiterminator RfaH|nr:transcription termination/antitermination NusG family protein [Pirellulales bacterium]